MGIDSSSFSSISNRYEGRFVRHWDYNNSLIIYDRKSDDNRNAQSQAATTDQKEVQLQHDLDEEEPVPYVVLVQGPPKVGKSMLIKSLAKFFTMHHLDNVRGPITVVSGKHRRLQFVECPNDVNGMIDAAKYADLVLFCIDASYGFEMETFEFFNLLQVHGFPNVIGVLTNLDKIKPDGSLKETKQRLSRQFRNEIYGGAEVFYLSNLDKGMYMDDEIHKLGAFISVMKFNPLSWQTAHPYVLVDHFEDVTSPERVHIDNKCDRNIVMYGYLRGSNFRRGTQVHIAGAGDFPVYGIKSLADPCSLPIAAKIKGVSDKERLFYAPMSGLGDLLYDKDAEYLDELNDIDEVTQSEIAGFRAGTYLKLEVRDVPFEMTKNIDPNHPILVGGISLEEENIGYMKAAFRISAIGVILDVTQAAEIVTKIMKKRKQIGSPLKTFKKTALIKDMFTSDLEIDWFEGAAIQTVRGVRGNIKKAARKKLVSELPRKGDVCSKTKDDPARRQQTVEQRRGVVFAEKKKTTGNRICKED
ncbi:ribosome biogenesis protein BMS1 homolog isoform X2 [Papaver somniferum]|uniref:ribosome biogenesis protein BMS1 homolog isoform X2 n=1 Tax=Papaver somniferum TaxID=3469 RepID=UPI000E6FA88D|nr:ribosome biogenesis protein BMS1 homolog isoform X2 [Papaver somniferum]